MSVTDGTNVRSFEQFRIMSVTDGTNVREDVSVSVHECNRWNKCEWKVVTRPGSLVTDGTNVRGKM